MESSSLRDYGPAAPHGPNMTGEHAHMDVRRDMSDEEASVFHAVLHPDDIYDANGTYWADLPMGQRVKFVTAVDAAETRMEVSSIWSMFKKDPLSPVGYYLKNMVVPGAGLLLEGYVFRPQVQSMH
jgi:hypothetical protein